MKIRKILILLLIFFINNLLYSTDIFFTAINNENFYSKKSSNKASGNLVKGKKYKSLNKAFWTQYGLRIKLNDNNEDIWVNAENIISNNGISEFDSDLIYNSNIKQYWVFKYYIDIAKKNNRSLIYKYEPYWESEIHFSTSSVYFFNSIITISNQYLLVNKIKKVNNNYYIVEVKKLNIYPYEIVSLNWEEISNKEMFNLIIQKNLNSITITIENQNNSICELIKIDHDFIKLFNDFINGKNISFNNIDKYLINMTIEYNTTYYTPTVNNLRLRSSSSLDSKVVKLMKKGEKLEFIEEGKKQTIDKINGTWIKVKTEDGKTGWCFDGYLKKIE